MSDARADILDRVRRKTGDALPPHEVSEALAELGIAPPAPTRENAVAALESQLLENHATIEHVQNRAAAVQRIARYVYESYRNYRVVAGNDPRLAAMPWRDGGVLVRFGAAEPDDRVAISYAQAGIGESGSLALFSNRHNPASNNWLTQDHIIICDAADAVLDYEHAWKLLERRQVELGAPRGIHLISGPSATADIGFEMVFGAHGPQRLHVLLVGAEITHGAEPAPAATNTSTTTTLEEHHEDV